MGFSNRNKWVGTVSFVRIPITIHYQAQTNTLVVRQIAIDELAGVNVITVVTNSARN